MRNNLDIYEENWFFLLFFDSEISEDHVITVSVRDEGGKGNLARVHVHVQDYNDHVPHFITPVYNLTVLDTSQLGSVVITVTASDPDHGSNGRVTYSIVAGMWFFHIFHLKACYVRWHNYN